MFDIGGANNRYGYSWHAQGETQCRCSGVSWTTLQKVIAEYLQSFPVGVGVVILIHRWLEPSTLRDRTLGDDAHITLDGGWKREVYLLLVGYVDRGL